MKRGWEKFWEKLLFEYYMTTFQIKMWFRNFIKGKRR